MEIRDTEQHSRPGGKKSWNVFLKKGGRMRGKALRAQREEEGQENDELFKTGPSIEC
jgi:hypothetical protein